jgi:hypothetical protein
MYLSFPFAYDLLQLYVELPSLIVIPDFRDIISPGETVSRRFSGCRLGFGIEGGSLAAVRRSAGLDAVCSALARGIDKPRHADTDGVERDHGSGEKTHVQDVSGGCDDCCDNKNDKD